MDHVLIAQRDAVRAVSAVLFGGAQYRLEICGALESGERVTAVGVADRLAFPPSKASVHIELQRLVQAGLLRRLNKIPGDRHTYLQVESSQLWQCARELAAKARHDATVASPANAMTGS
jgi:hypothetical protein